MNKMHTLAKIILSAIGIFFAIRLLPQLVLPIFMMFGYGRSSENMWTFLSSILLTICLIVLLIRYLVYKNDALAEKIVGSEQFAEPDLQIQWLPVALRLICMAGGIYFINTVLWKTTYLINQLAFLKTRNANTIYTNSYAQFSLQNILPLVIMLMCGIYLLCGAPHFVRWHVKKILKQCKSQSEKTNNNQ